VTKPWFNSVLTYKALYNTVRGVHASLFEQVVASGRHASVRRRVPAPIITSLTNGTLIVPNHPLTDDLVIFPNAANAEEQI
jgi:hypothetical protein